MGRVSKIDLHLTSDALTGPLRDHQSALHGAADTWVFYSRSRRMACARRPPYNVRSVSPAALLGAPMRLLVTAGNTLALVDRVRCLTNVFTGRTGAAIALCAHQRGHAVTLLTSHPEAVTPPAAGK